MKLSKINPTYIFAGVVLLVVVVYYSTTNPNPTVDNALLPVASEQEEDATPAVEEKKTEPVIPASTHVNCATNDWDCFAKAATEGNTATMVSFMDDFPYLFTGYMLDVTTKFDITNVASNGDVTLREEMTKVIVNPIPYTDEQLKEMAENWGIDEEITLEKIEEGRLEADEYWQSRVGNISIGVYTLESFLVFVEQWESQKWSIKVSLGSGDTPLGQPYKVIRDDSRDEQEPFDWAE